MQQPTGLQLPEPSHEKHPPSRPSNMKPGQPKACPQRPNPKRRSPNNCHTGVRRNLGKGKIDSDDIFEMETEWIPALIFLNHLRTCINVHTSKPNTLIDKIHKTSFNIFTSFNLFTNSDLGHSHSNMLFSKIQLTNLSVWFLCLIQEHLKEEDCCYPERKGLSKGFRQ